MAEVPDIIIKNIKKFKERIKKDINVKKVFLFGSYARGTYSEYSDIDVCIIADKSENNYLSMLKIAPMTIGIDMRIEAVVFSFNEYLDKKPAGLLREIIEHGIEI